MTTKNSDNLISFALITSLLALHLTVRIANKNGIGILYASLLATGVDSDHTQAFDRLHGTVAQLLSTSNAGSTSGATDARQEAHILWRLQYVQHTAPVVRAISAEKNTAVHHFTPLGSDLALEDDVLQEVRGVWRSIVGESMNDDDFMKFEPRQAEMDEDEM